MNLSLHLTIGIPSSYPDSPSWAGLTARVQGCPTRPRPPDGPTGLLRHFTQQSFPRFRWHDGSRSSSELTAPVLLSDCAKPLRAAHGAVPAALPEPPAAPRPYLLLGSRAEALGSRVHGSRCRRLSPAGPARTRPARPGGGAGSGRGAAPGRAGAAHTRSHILLHTHTYTCRASLRNPHGNRLLRAAHPCL